MIKITGLAIVFALILLADSCTLNKGIWDDNIHLSAKTALFNASGDSVTIKTRGSSWWVSDISVDSNWFYGFTGIDLMADRYSIQQDCFDVEHRDKNTLFIKVNANPNKVKRMITVGLEAGDYFDRVTITQSPN